MKVFSKILCSLGIHDWEHFGHVDESSYFIHYKICKRCNIIIKYFGGCFSVASLEEAVKLNIETYLNLTELVKIVNSQCPVCGYYCLGKGGKGCIDKKQMYRDEIERLNKLYR